MESSLSWLKIEQASRKALCVGDFARTDAFDDTEQHYTAKLQALHNTRSRTEALNGS
jgi:hypothetical protein